MKEGELLTPLPKYTKIYIHLRLHEFDVVVCSDCVIVLRTLQLSSHKVKRNVEKNILGVAEIKRHCDPKIDARHRQNRLF